MSKLHSDDLYVCGIYCYILGCYLTVYADEDFEIVRISDKFNDINCDDSDVIDEIIDTNDFYDRKHFRDHLLCLMDIDISTDEVKNERRYEAAMARLEQNVESGCSNNVFNVAHMAIKDRASGLDPKGAASMIVGGTVGAIGAVATYGVLTAAGVVASAGKYAFDWAQKKLSKKI